VPCLFIFQSAFQYRCTHAPLAVFIQRHNSKISAELNDLLLVNETLPSSFIQLLDIANGSIYDSYKKLEEGEYICDSLDLDNNMTTASKVMTAIAVFLILATNGLMIVIANVDKTLKSPVFVIIQSLSATSIIRGIMFFLMKFVGCYMLQFAYDMSRSRSTACHIQKLDEYVDNVILFQLCLLVIQRLALTISPLKVHLLMTRKHVMKAIGVTVMASLIVDTLFAIFVTTTCQEVKERINYDSPQVVYRMCLALFLVFLLVCSMIISLVRRTMSGVSLQVTSQQQQSKVASIAIISFMSVYVFVFGLNIYIYYACPADTNVFLASNFLVTYLPLLLYNIIPIVLFLRLKSIRNFILRPCKCINSDE